MTHPTSRSTSEPIQKIRRPPVLYPMSVPQEPDWEPHPLPPSEVLPTMYDLPSEDPEEPGLPDEFHDYQPDLLKETCQPGNYSPEEMFIGSDLNLYYDANHPLWYKRPDWFLVLGVSSGDRIEQLRLSYVMWQESVSPFIVVELLSPGTEGEDLGTRKTNDPNKPPLKWELYERILRVPFYVVFDRYDQQLRIFVHEQSRYREVELAEERYWFEPLELGLGVWTGRYQGVEGRWIRWYDRAGNWVPTADERAEQEKQRADQEAAARRAAIPRLRAMGLTRSQIAEALSLQEEEVLGME